jgi:hypothetical protein
MLSRGFGVKWIAQVINLLQGSQTCININGQTMYYSTCKRWLQQGDPLSPFLFVLVIDALCQVLFRGQQLHLV